MRGIAVCLLALACQAGAADLALSDDVAGAERACRTALANGQPLEAARAAQDLPRGPLQELLQARIALALGDAPQALRLLGASDPGALSASLGRWGDAERGEAAQTAAEAALAAGAPQLVGPLVARAEAAGGAQVEPDRCVALRMQAALALHDVADAQATATELWRTGIRSPYRSRAGLVLAQAWAAERPDEARDVLAVVRTRTPVGPVRLGAAELLCALLLPSHPGECAAVAGDEMARIAAAGGTDVGTLPRWQALALVRIDPQAGDRALRALPPSLAHDPMVAHALQAPTAAVVGDAAMVRERAQMRAGMGDVAGARALLAPVCATDPSCLALLLSLPGTDPLRWRSTPSARTPVGAAALAQALVSTDADADAWAVVAPFCADPHATDAVLAAAAACAPTADLRRQLRSRLFALASTGTAVGMAWCAEAEDRQAGGLDATDAWCHAARALPSTHPYQAEAAWRAARLLMAVGRSDAAVALLDGPASWTGDTPACCRCRFLLAQIWLREGNRPAALHAARSLRGLGDAAQAQRLEALITSIDGTAPAR